MVSPRPAIFPSLTVIFLLVPIIEIYLLIRIGGLIGVMPTIVLVILTAFIGAILLRIQGLQTYRRFHQALRQGRVPTTEILEGIALLIGGALLLTPGFFTDVIGFICLLPFSRRFVIAWLAARFKPLYGGGLHGSETRLQEGNVYEGKVTRHGDDD